MGSCFSQTRVFLFEYSSSIRFKNSIKSYRVEFEFIYYPHKSSQAISSLTRLSRVQVQVAYEFIQLEFEYSATQTRLDSLAPLLPLLEKKNFFLKITFILIIWPS